MRYVCLVFSLTAAAAAGTLAGTVFDPSGGAVPNAAVVLRDGAGIEQQTTTGADGQYQFASLAPGRYQVEVRAPGFALHRTGASVGAGTAAGDLVLRLGGIQETLTVAAALPAGVRPAALPRKVRVGGNVQPPLAVKQPRVAYPAGAKSRGATGSVVIRAIVGREGGLLNPMVLASPDDELTRAALEGIAGWQYQPARLNGEAVETETLVTVRFEAQ